MTAQSDWFLVHIWPDEENDGGEAGALAPVG
jgi:hypothetical protein